MWFPAEPSDRLNADVFLRLLPDMTHNDESTAFVSNSILHLSCVWWQLDCKNALPISVQGPAADCRADALCDEAILPVGSAVIHKGSVAKVFCA